jgi:SNF2 family DNA or RNA helicase
MRSLKDLRPAQNFLVDYALERPFCLWGADMGFGKTAAGWTVAKIWLDCKYAEKILIVAPKRVAKDTWPDEHKEWAHLKNLKYSIVLGEMNLIDRGNAALSDAPVHIVNRENLVWLWEFFQNGRTWPYDALIYDEASRLKAWKHRSAVVRRGEKKTGGRLNEYGVLAKARKQHFKRVVELSGTPSPNGLQDLGGLIYMLDLGERLGSSRKAFLTRWFEDCPYTRKISPKPFAMQQITDRISDICVTLKTEDYVDLPDQVNIPYYVYMDAKTEKKYKTLLNTRVLWEEEIRAKSAGVLAQKLLQLCNGSIYRNDDYGERIETIEIHDLKAEALKDIIDRAGDKPILVAYSYEFDKERIKAKFPNAQVFEELEDAVQKWNNGEVQLMIAHPASIGHGLNLQKGSNICVWYGLTWSLELYQQFNRRLLRPGQKEEKVIIYHILTQGTYDEKVYEVLAEKAATQDEVLEILSADKALVDTY